MNHDTKCPVRTILQQILRQRPKSHVNAKSRIKKKELHTLSSFFIVETWKLMLVNGLESNIHKALKTYPKDFSSLNSYISHLNKRNSCFGWAWIRARIEDQVQTSLDQVLAIVEKTHPNEWKKYKSLLLKNGFYWFRQSIKQHLRLGYHTAVSVIVKLIGTYKYQTDGEFKNIDPQYTESTFDVCKIFAAFDLELLLSSDGELWDSAAATSYQKYSIENNELYLPSIIVSNVLDKLSARKQADKKAIVEEPILGCPAMKAFLQTSSKSELETVFRALFDLVIKIIDENQSYAE